MKKLIIATLGCLFIYLVSCKYEPVYTQQDLDLESSIKTHSKTGNINWFIMPESSDYANFPNQDPKNPVTKAKVELGNLLFFETGIGIAPKKAVSMATYSCSSCHIPEKNFTAGRFQGIADGGIGYGILGSGRFKNPTYDGTEVDAQGARPLPVINLSYVRNALWNGAFGSFGMNEGTESVWGVGDTLTKINLENREGLEAVITRALIVHRQVINKDILDKLGYTAMFDKAFPDLNEQERYSPQAASHALAAYFRSIYTNQAPFQKWLKGDKSAMTVEQKNGAALFFGKAKCVNCHNGPSLNGQRFAAVGVKDLDQIGETVFKTNDGRSKGRASFTLDNNDLYKFKVPELYNMKGNDFYFHGASKHNLKDVVQYFNYALPENPNVTTERLDPFFKPLGLTEKEVNDLTEFIENGLFDPNLIRYKPSSVMSGNCFPNNDTRSKLEMGCN